MDRVSSYRKRTHSFSESSTQRKEVQEDNPVARRMKVQIQRSRSHDETPTVYPEGLKLRPQDVFPKIDQTFDVENLVEKFGAACISTDAVEGKAHTESTRRAVAIREKDLSEKFKAACTISPKKLEAHKQMIRIIALLLQQTGSLSHLLLGINAAYSHPRNPYILNQVEANYKDLSQNLHSTFIQIRKVAKIPAISIPAAFTINNAADTMRRIVDRLKIQSIKFASTKKREIEAEELRENAVYFSTEIMKVVTFCEKEIPRLKELSQEHVEEL